MYPYALGILLVRAAIDLSNDLLLDPFGKLGEVLQVRGLDFRRFSLQIADKGTEDWTSAAK